MAARFPSVDPKDFQLDVRPGRLLNWFQITWLLWHSVMTALRWPNLTIALDDSLLVY
jgi:hypothetical protein